MTTFLRLIEDKDKDKTLISSCSAFRADVEDTRVYHVQPDSFRAVPGAPFAYWVSDDVRDLFKKLPRFGGTERKAKVGLQTGDDFRFVRGWWEIESHIEDWPPFAKGGAYSPFYADVYLVVNWANSGKEISKFANVKTGKLYSVLRNTDYYRRPGLTWGDRTSSFLSVKPWPAGGVFSVKGSAGFVPDGDIYFILGLMNSRPFNAFLEMMVNAGGAVSRSYQVGVISNVPYPLADFRMGVVGDFARKAWALKRTIDTTEETSHAFHLPATLRARLGDYDLPAIEAELNDIHAKIDEITFDLYGFSDGDRTAALASSAATNEDASDVGENAGNSEDDDGAETIDQTDGLLSWAAGVAFGRFDWRLATGEREAPPEPEPFDPLPAKSPGMLPDDAEPFYVHSGILVDDQGHPKDLARLIEEVLAPVEVPVPADVRRWLQRDFFPFHLKNYSKSRRKAPIYWPISTNSGSYTLWLYYPSLTDQTLFTAVNDFIEPKLEQVGQDVTALRTKGSARSAADEKSFEKLQSLEAELIELRETLLEIAPTYRPNHDDGVQISAAPLWRLFRHKPWQKVLKDTWTKLDKGDYDWAHLAMAYWPDRVREKCKTDKSLAIAHDLEGLYEEPEVTPGTKQGRKKTEDDA